MPQRVQFNDFSGGINNNSPQNQIADNQVADALNLIFDKTSNLKVRNGLTRINWNKNILTRTEELGHADWVAIGVIVPTADTDLAPDGTMTADSLNDNSNAAEGIKQTEPCLDDEVYTASIYIKKTGVVSVYPVFRIAYKGGSNLNFSIVVNTGNGTIIEVAGEEPDSYSIEDVDDYWRISLTATNDASSNTNVAIEIYPGYASSLDGTLDPTATAVNIFWGAQLELGLLSRYHKNVATAPSVSSNYLFSPITSIFDYRLSNNTSCVLVTSGANVYRLNSSDYLDLIAKGSLGLPDGTYWDWVTYDDVALGVNRGTKALTQNGLVKVDGLGGNVELLNWNVNYLLYTEQFDNLIWKSVNSPLIEINTESSPLGDETADKIENRSNLALQTESLDNASWVAFNTPIITAGDADKIEDNSAVALEGVYQIITVANSETYVGSVYVKKTSGATVFPALDVRFTGGTTLLSRVYINTNTGEIVDETGNASDEKGVTDEGTFWRFWNKKKNNATGNTSLEFRIFPAASSTIGTVDVAAVGSNIFWGAQLERDVLTDYHKNTDSTVNGIYQEIVVANSETYIGSLYVKKTSAKAYYPLVQLKYVNGGTPLTAGAIIDTNNGTLTDQSGSAFDLKGIEDHNTYWRVWFKKANNATANTRLQLHIYPSRAIALTGILNDITPGFNIFWGAQLEKTTGAVSKYHKNVSSANVLSPPNGVFIEVWNNRIWVVDSDEPHVVVSSGLGNYEDYASPGKAGSQRFHIGGNEGSPVTGLKAFKDRLFLFKENYIYYIQPGTPNTDITQYEIKLLTDNIGCVLGNSIQIVLNDVVFLSRYGQASLTAVEQFGNFAESSLSNQIRDLNTFHILSNTGSSIINSQESQYWLLAPLSGGTNNDALWVMDYTNIQNRQVAYTRFDGKIVGSSLGSVLFNGQDRVYVGGTPQADDSGITYLYRYGDELVYNDDGKMFNVSLLSKSHSIADTLNNAIFIRVFYVVDLITTDLELGLLYRFNESSAAVKSWAALLSGDIFIGGIWDTSTWDDFVWASPGTSQRVIERKVLGFPGRIARSIQFGFSNSLINQGFIIKQYGFDFDPATHKKT